MAPDWATRACLVAVAAATVQMLFVLSAYVDANASGTDTSADDVKNKLAIKNACVDLVAAVVLLVTHVTTVTIYVRRVTETTKTTRASYVSVTRRAHVIRDGKTRLVDPKELVPGDVVVVTKGDVAPADILLSAQSDETVLVSVSADGTDLANVIRSGDVLPRGAEVRAGEARGIVARTGDFSGDFSVFGSTRVDDVTRGYSRDDDSAVRRFRLRSAYATASCALACFLIGAVTFARSGSEKSAETDDEDGDADGFGFFGAVAFATALVVATAPVSARATRSAVRAATAAEFRRACRGSVAAFASASGEKDDRWLRLAAAETVLLDESALLKDGGKHVVREVRMASGLASSLVGPRDVLTCAALASRFNAEVSGPTDGVRRGFSDAADAAVADALGGTETLSQTYALVSRGRFRASEDSDEDEDEDAVECLVERLADGSRFRARRGAPSATLASCGADPETAEEMLAAAAACERAGLRCLLVAAHHGAPPSGNPPAKREDKSSSEEARQELARDDNLFFADERAESNKDASNVAASEDSSEDSGWTVLGLVAFEVPYRRDARETLARLNSLGTSVVLLTRGEAATPRAALASTRSDDDESSSSHRECSDEPVFFSTLSLEEARDETSPFRRSFLNGG
jgi:magnesium-transporting ATPase (P-type)